MASVNKVIILGNLGKDPDIHVTKSGTSIANMSVATSFSWKDKDSGEREEKTEWHKVAMFGKLAEIAGEYLTKGSKVYLEGRLQSRSWEDDEGNTRYTTEIVAHEMKMLGDKKEGGEKRPKPKARKPEVVDSDDGIPF